jgi:putative flippase GtrA
MQDEASSYALLLRELRQPTHWLQLARFAAVGAGGYAINLVVFAGAVSAGLHYLAAATVAFVVALVNNFVWNRAWTFRGAHGTAHGQALRFLGVSVGAFLLSLAILDSLVRVAGVAKLPAEALAVLAVTPLSFLANKLWSFGARPPAG